MRKKTRHWIDKYALPKIQIFIPTNDLLTGLLRQNLGFCLITELKHSWTWSVSRWVTAENSRCCKQCEKPNSRISLLILTKKLPKERVYRPSCCKTYLELWEWSGVFQASQMLKTKSWCRWIGINAAKVANILANIAEKKEPMADYWNGKPTVIKIVKPMWTVSLTTISSAVYRVLLQGYKRFWIQNCSSSRHY